MQARKSSRDHDGARPRRDAATRASATSLTWHGPPNTTGLDHDGVVALQRQAGNAAVVDLLHSTQAVQRAPAATAAVTHAKVAAHHPPAKTPGRPTDNPTFQDARDYVRTYFQRQKEIGALLVDMKDTGFRNFQVHSSEEYNKEESLAGVLFEAALAAVPAGGALLASYKKLAGGAKFSVDLAEKLHKVAEGTEAVIGVGEKVGKAGKAVAKVPEAAAGESEARKLGDFQAEQITNLAELRVDNLVQRWTEEDLIIAALEAVRYAAPEQDLNAMVSSTIGPTPTAGGLKEAMLKAAEMFEIKLYIHYYVDGGKIYNNQVQGYAGVYSTTYNNGWPSGVRHRLEALHGMPNPSTLPMHITHVHESGKFL